MKKKAEDKMEKQVWMKIWLWRMIYGVINAIVVVCFVYLVFLKPEIRSGFNSISTELSAIAAVGYVAILIKSASDTRGTRMLPLTSLAMFGLVLVIRGFVGMSRPQLGPLEDEQRGYLMSLLIGAGAVIYAHNGLPKEEPKSKKDLGSRK